MKATSFVILDTENTGIGYSKTARNQYNVQLVSRISTHAAGKGDLTERTTTAGVGGSTGD